MLEPTVAIGDVLEVLYVYVCDVLEVLRLRAGGEPSECEADIACILVWAMLKTVYSM